MSLLPRIDHPAQVHALLAQPRPCEQAIEEIRRRHDVCGPLERPARGSAVVYVGPRHCIKLHPPLPGFVSAVGRELTALRRVAGRLPVATPELVAAGELEGWPYFVATRVPGRAIDELWSELEPGRRTSLAQRLGEAIRALHQLPTEGLPELDEPWLAFRQAQRERCLAREREKQLAPAHLRELQDYLERGDATPERVFTPALLHTEIGPSHVLVDGDEIAGLIDFGDAMIGDPEYDLAAVGMFVTRGDRAAWRAFLDAWDPGGVHDPDRSGRLMRHALLHRYGTLAWYLDTLRPPALDLDGLEDFWFGEGEERSTSTDLS